MGAFVISFAALARGSHVIPPISRAFRRCTPTQKRNTAAFSHHAPASYCLLDSLRNILMLSSPQGVPSSRGHRLEDHFFPVRAPTTCGSGVLMISAYGRTPILYATRGSEGAPLRLALTRQVLAIPGEYALSAVVGPHHDPLPLALRRGRYRWIVPMLFVSNLPHSFDPMSLHRPHRRQECGQRARNVVSGSILGTAFLL